MMKYSMGKNSLWQSLCAVTLTLLLAAGMTSVPAWAGTGKAHAGPGIQLQQYVDKADLGTAWGTVTGVDNSGNAIMADPINATYQKIRFGTYNNVVPVDHWVAGTEDGGDTLVLYQAVPTESRQFNNSTGQHSPAGDFNYSAAPNHWGMSDIRAYLNRGLGTPGSEGTKTGRADTSDITTRSRYERDYYHPAESAKLIPFGMTTYYETGSDYTTVDRFSLPSGNWESNYDGVISFGKQDVVTNAKFSVENPLNFIPRNFWTIGGSSHSWLRSQELGNSAMTTAMTIVTSYTLVDTVTVSHEFATISRINISDALFAAPIDSPKRVDLNPTLALRYRAKGALANAVLTHDKDSGEFSISNVPENTRLSVLMPSGEYSSFLLPTGYSETGIIPEGVKFWLEQDGTGADSGLIFAKRPNEDFVFWDEESPCYTLTDLSGDVLKNPIVTQIGKNITFRINPKPGYEGYKFTPYANDVRCNYSQGVHGFGVADPLTNIKVDIELNQVQKNYDVTFPSGTGYTVMDTAFTALAGKHTVAGGSKLNFSVQLDSKYSNSAVKVYANGAELKAADGVYSLQVFEDTAVTVEGVGMNQFPITIPSGAEYTVTDINGKAISGIQHALQGSDFSFRVQPNTGYGAVTVRVNGTVLAPADGVSADDVYIIKNILQAQNVTITSEGLKKLNITIPSGAGFTVTDGSGNLITGTQTVVHNGDFLFRTDAAEGYVITEVRVNGGIVYPEGGTYALRNITEDKAITVAVRLKQYTLTFPPGEGYSVTDVPGANSLGTKTVSHGDSYSFKVPIISGYDGSGLEVFSNGERIMPNGEGIYTLNNIKENKSITFAGVKVKTYTVTFVYGTGYSYRDFTGAVISSVTVAHGQSYAFNVAMDAAYSNDTVYTVQADGQTLTGTGSYVVSNVTKNITVVVSGVDLNKYKVQYDLAGGEGDYPDKTVTHGENLTLAAAPKKEGYEFKGWILKGNRYAAGSGTIITEDVVVSALWEKIENDSMPIWTVSLIAVGALAAVLILILVIRAIRKSKRNSIAE